MRDDEYASQIGDFYTSLTTDKRFILLDNACWDLRDRHKIEIILDDEEEADEAFEDEDNEEDDNETEEDDIDAIDDESIEQNDALDDLTILDEDEIEE